MDDKPSDLCHDSSHWWCPDPVIIADAGAKEDVVEIEEEENNVVNDTIKNDLHKNLKADTMKKNCLKEKPPSTPHLGCPALYLSPKMYPYCIWRMFGIDFNLSLQATVLRNSPIISSSFPYY
jgi:heterodisulfide reductase subunit B